MANGGVGAQLLQDRVNKSITKMQEPQTGTCPSHGAMSDGILTLLECKKYDLNNDTQGGNTDVELFGGQLLRIKNCKITGRDIVMIVLFVCMMAMVMKEYIVK